jgi:hypothetical protein
MDAISDSPGARGRAIRVGILVAGVVLGQAVLFGPSLVGQKILLPLDILAEPGFYLPATPDYKSIVPQNAGLSDEVLNYEFSRRFAAAEFRAGRLPLWTPYSFAGTPFAHFGKYSPFSVIYYCFPSPVTLAWIQLIKSLVAAGGAYLFFRRVLAVGFWPAVFGAWCYPLTGFFVLWQGYPITFVTAWFPWVLLATESVVRRPRGWGGPVLAVLTCLTILSGHVDVAGQVMLASGLFAIWGLVDTHGKSLASLPALGTAAATVGAWTLGFSLSAPYFLPLVEYARTGSRILKREAGSEERPPVGLAALPQTVLPGVYGWTHRGSIYLPPRNLPGGPLESAAATYTGLLATLLAAPLAWCSPRHRSINCFWLVLAFLGLAWVLNVPGLVQLLRLPLLNMLSHNRSVFVTSFAILALAVTGLDMLGSSGLKRRRWFIWPAALLVGLAGWCAYRAVALPEPLATRLEATVRVGRPVPGVPDLAAVAEVRQNFRRMYIESAVLSAIGVAGWLIVLRTRNQSESPAREAPASPALRGGSARWLGPLLGVLLVGDLLWFAYDINPQCDPALYYPPVPALEELAAAPPGRVLGVHCLPSNLNEVYYLRDVRGYDGIDPLPMMELLDRVRNPQFSTPHDMPRYARTQWYVPAIEVVPSERTIKVPPILNMLNVRYLILRNRPVRAVTPLIAHDDYWIIENRDAAPRLYIPRHVEIMTDASRLLVLLAAKEFDSTRIAYVDGPVTLPTECRGTAKIVDEVPARITVAADMQTRGLLVLADRWDGGWRAYLDGEPVPILRTNHALRGVELPAGQHALVFAYEPASLVWGVRLMAAAVLGLLVWVVLVLRAKR